MIEIAVSDAAFETSDGFASWCSFIMDSIVALNRDAIRRGKVGDIYQSNIRFRADPPGLQTFCDAITVKKRGYGHCADLCAWRRAWLNEHGEPAELSIKWEYPLFHVRVRRADGRLEDVARVLGMPQGAVA